MIEYFVLFFVAWNAILQTYWFFWSRKIQKRKHKEDK